MGIRQAAMQELARRELARREEARTGTPNIIEEQHEGVSFADRFKIKNFGDEPEKSAAYLKRTNPQLDTRVWDGRVLVKNKNETDWRVVDPDAEGFDGIGEFAKDVTDLAYDIPSMALEGLATAGGALLGSAVAPGAGTAAGGIAGSALAGGASEALRQKLGVMAGVNEEVDMGDVALTGVLSGAIPMVPGALVKGAKVGKGAIKGAAKFLSGAKDKDLARMTREGERAISKMETETVVPTIERISESMGNKVDAVQAANAKRIADYKANFNIADDVELEKVLREQADAIQSKPNFDQAKVADIENMIADIPATREVRAAMGRVGGDADAIAKEAFPGVPTKGEAIQTMAGAPREALELELKAIQDKYAQLEASGGQVNVESVKEFYDQSIDKLRSLNSKDADKVAGALEKDFKSKFTVKNPNYSPDSLQRDQLTGQMMGGDKYASEGIKMTQGQSGRLSSVYTPDKIDKTSKVLFERVMPYDKAKYTKDVLGNAYKQAKKKASIGASTKGIEKYQQQVERILNDAMDTAVAGGKKELDPDYVRIGDALKLSDNLFKDEAAVNQTLKKVLKGDEGSDIVLRQIDELDDVAGTKYRELMNDMIEAQGKTSLGIAQGKAAGKAGARASRLAEKAMTPKEKLFAKLTDNFTKKTNQGGNIVYKPDTKATWSSINEYASKNDPMITKTVDDLADKYGEAAAKEFKDGVDNIGLAAIFGDESKTLIKNIERGQASNAARGFAQATAYQFVGAGGAQVAGSIGKAIGDKLGIKQALRKTLPVYFEKKAALKGLSDTAKKELEEKIINSTIRRRDLIRELSKKTATSDNRR